MLSTNLLEKRIRQNSIFLGFLYSISPDPEADLRKNRTPDIGPREKPDPKYWIGVKQEMWIVKLDTAWLKKGTFLFFSFEWNRMRSETLHKKWSFPLRTFLVNVIKPARNIFSAVKRKNWTNGISLLSEMQCISFPEDKKSLWRFNVKSYCLDY